MVKNIIFDMGNVLLKFDPDAQIAKLGVSEEDSKLLKEIVFDKEAWPQLDLGTMDEAELVEALKPKLPERLHEPMRKLVMEWDKEIEEVPGMDALTERLKRDSYILYLLTNASRRQHEYWPRMSVAPYFDGIVVSADVHMVKPDPAIYTLLLQRFDLEAGTCVYIDDREDNVEAARSVGMFGVLFDGDVAKLKEDLKALCVGDAV